MVSNKPTTDTTSPSDQLTRRDLDIFAAKIDFDKFATKDDLEKFAIRTERTIGKAVDDLSEVIQGVVQHFEGRFDESDSRFAQIDARFDRVDARFDRVDARFDGIDTDIATLTFEQREMKAQLFQMQRSIDDILRRLDKLESVGRAVNNDLEELYDGSVTAKQNSSEIHAMKQEVKQLWQWAEQVSRETGIKLPKVTRKA